MFRFAHPIYLYLLLLIPVLTLVFMFFQYRKKKNLAKFGDMELLRHLMPDVSPVRIYIKFGLLMAAVALIAIIMARPQYGTRNEEVKRSGIEVMIAVDVSNSMLCQDVNPSRLEKSKMMVSKLVEQFDQDKLGLVAYAGTAITLLPMTNDYVSAKMFLNMLAPSSVSVQGTNTAEAITRALKGFSEKTGVGRALILITDAEDHEDGAIEAAKLAKKAGIRIFVLSIGTAVGGPIPMGSAGYKKDMNGNIVTTKLNEQIGKEIAHAGGGLYIHVDQSDQAQSVLSDEIDKMQKEDISTSMTSEYDEQFVAVALILFLILIIELCIMERQNQLFSRIRIFNRNSAAVLLLPLTIALTSCGEKSSRDYIRLGNRAARVMAFDIAETNYLKSIEKEPTFEGYYNYAYSTLAQQQDSTAFSNFVNADSIGTTNQLKRAKNFHNMGNIWYMQGVAQLNSNQQTTDAFAKAVAFYKSALRCNPNDNETRYNLAKAQWMLKNGKNNNQQQQQDQQQQQQDQQQDQQQQQEQPQEQKDEMSDQAAEQLLNSAQQDEKNVQKKVNQQNSRSRSLEKDW